MDLATAAAVMKVVSATVKTANDFGWIDRLRRLFSTTHHVLLLGSSGTGKSQLLTALEDLLPEAISGYARTQVRENREVMISSKFFNFIDTPGHGGPPGHLHDEGGATQARRAAIKEAFGKPLAAVINVVSYGYHEAKPPAPAEAFDADRNISESFLEINRAREIKAMEEWVGMFGHPHAPTRLITVVTKADLWWSRRAEVLGHYSKNSYFKSLGPAKNIAHVIVESSSVFHKFYGEGALDGSFDQEQRAELRGELLRQLLLLQPPQA